VKGSGHGLIKGTVLAFAWWDWGKLQKKLSHDSQSLGSDFNPGPSKYEAEC
jgi:hypothetical protein